MIKYIYLSQLILLPLSIASFSNSGSFVDSNRIDAVDSKDKIIYIDISLNDKYKEDNSSPYLTYNDGTDNHNINLIYINNDIYQTETYVSYALLSSTTSFYVSCFSGTYKTIDINFYTFIDTYNYLCLGSYSDGNDTNIKGYGCYGYQIDNPGATYLTQRVWLNNENSSFYENDEWGNPCKNAVGYYFNNKWNIITMVEVTNNYDNKSYYYVDIPYTLRSITFLKISQSDSHNYLIYEAINIKAVSYGICYFMDVDKYEVYTSPVNDASAYVLGCVLEAYLTFGTNPSNGSVTATVQNLFFTWYKAKKANDSEMKKTMILDYSSYSRNNNGYENSKKDSYYSVDEKWLALCRMASVDSKTGDIINDWTVFFSNNLLKFLVLIGTAVSFSVGGIIIFLGKKKRNRKED